MYKNKTKFIALPLIAGCVVLLAAFSPRESQPPAIVSQPEDQMIRAGADATLSVKANDGNSYQWMRNGVAVPGETTPTLSIPKIEIKDAGNYSCIVSKGVQSVVSRVAALLVYVNTQAQKAAGTQDGAVAQPMGGGYPIMVYGSPVCSSGSSGSCPGSYAGYVMFIKSPGWGWSPASGTTVYTAADGGGRSDTTVEYMGNSSDEGCDQTEVAVPYPAYSSKYRFMIFFPNNVPTTNYPIILTGFNP